MAHVPSSTPRRGTQLGLAPWGPQLLILLLLPSQSWPPWRGAWGALPDPEAQAEWARQPGVFWMPRGQGVWGGDRHSGGTWLHRSGFLQGRPGWLLWGQRLGLQPMRGPSFSPAPHTWHAPHPPAAGPSPARLRRPSGGPPVGPPPLPRQPRGPLAAASQGFSKRPALTPTLAPPRSGHPLRPEPSGQRLSGLCLRGAVRPLGGQRDHCRAPSAEPPGRAGLWTAGMAPGPRVGRGWSCHSTGPSPPTLGACRACACCP